MKKYTPRTSSTFTTIAFFVLLSTIHCSAGLFDKINTAVNTANAIVKTNTPSQETVAKQPDQNSQVANANSVTAKPNSIDSKTVEQPTNNGTAPTLQPTVTNEVPPATKIKEEQSAPHAEPPVPKVKAFKTLNFGDDSDEVQKKLGEIVVDGNKPDELGALFAGDDLSQSGVIFWRLMVDSDADYEPYKYVPGTSAQSKKFESLENYFSRNVGVFVFSSENSAMSVNCYCFESMPQLHGGLTIVEVNYEKYDLDKLVGEFTQNFPNARKSDKPYKIESTMYPGVFLEFSQTLYEDTNADRKATLAILAETFTFSFTEPSNLTKDQLDAWNALMAEDGRTTHINEYFQSVKNALLAAKNMQVNDGLHAISDLGWDYGQYVPLIGDSANVSFVSKTIFGTQLNNYRQSIVAADQAEKAKLKKESDASSGF